MPWTHTQRTRHYGYYHSRAMDLLRKLEAPQRQAAELERIIQVATSLSRACPFSPLNHVYQTIIHQATAALTDIAGTQREA
jgi:hypothetical protein